MLQDFQNIFHFTITVGDVFQNILIAFLCGLVIAFLYRITYRGPGYSITFLNSLVILSVITSIVIMVIGNNLARAFGLVGAMSIIRFRTAVKETHDIVFIFFSLVIGMAAGVGFHAVAITGTLCVGIILLVLTKGYLVSPKQREFLLQFAYSSAGEAEEAPYLAFMKKYCKRNRLINVKSIGEGDILELSYYVELKSVRSSKDFIKELKRLDGVGHVNLFFDDERFYA